MRDLSGKACWDASILYKTPEILDKDKSEVVVDSQYEKTSTDHYVQPESFIMNTPIHTLPQRAMRHRPPNVLPDTSNAAPDLDQLDDVSVTYFLTS